MEKRYWELREQCERAYDRWIANRCESNYNAYNAAFENYQEFCTEVLEKLMDENSDVLKNLKNRD